MENTPEMTWRSEQPDTSDAKKGTPAEGMEINGQASADDTTDEPVEAAALPPRTAHGFVWLLIVAGILMANFLFATDNTIAANIQPAVVKEFQSLDKLAWMGVAFLAASWGTNFFWYVVLIPLPRLGGKRC